MRAKNKRTLTELHVTRAKLAPGPYYDDRERGLFLRVRASGRRGFYFMYNFHGRTRWYNIGLIPLADARRIVVKLRLAVAEGKDPQAERKEERGAPTFAELAERYVNEDAKKNNPRSWRQADALVRAHLLPRWGRKIAREITRADVRKAIGAIASPSVANAVWVAASAIFSFGVKVEELAFNPVRGVERHKLPSRARVISDSELKAFWPLLSPPLRAVLLLGQRPGEVLAMRREHVKDGWWEMPGAPLPKLGWPGVKNGRDHRVWLPRAVREIVGDGVSGRVFPRRPELDAQMREICRQLGFGEKVTPHDLRRSWTTRAAESGVTRLIVDRVLNHVDRSVTGGVYDRYAYSREIMAAMERVAEHIVALAEGRPASGAEVVRGVFSSKA
jgi:integrase